MKATFILHIIETTLSNEGNNEGKEKIGQADYQYED